MIAPRPRGAPMRWQTRLLIAISIVVPGCVLPVILLSRTFVMEPFRVPSPSMKPAIDVGQYILIQKWGYGHYSLFGARLLSAPISAPIRRGDIIVFDYPPDPEQNYVKRVVGLPGDHIDYHDKTLTINGIPAAENATDRYGKRTAQIERLDGHAYQIMLRNEIPANIPTDSVISFADDDRCEYASNGVSCTVPPGHYYVMGDNRDQSADSRYWGFVPAANIVGKLVYAF